MNIENVPLLDEEEEEEDPTKKLEALKWKRNIIFLTMFLLGTFFQAYTGIKCVEFEFTHDKGLEKKEAICFGCIVLAINLELWLLKALLQSKTEASEGLLQKEIHHDTARISAQVYCSNHLRLPPNHQRYLMQFYLARFLL